MKSETQYVLLEFYIVFFLLIIKWCHITAVLKQHKTQEIKSFGFSFKPFFFFFFYVGVSFLKFMSLKYNQVCICLGDPNLLFKLFF